MSITPPSQLFNKQQYDNTNSGVLFKVEDKQSDRHPDYRGELNAAGVDLLGRRLGQDLEEGREVYFLQIEAENLADEKAGLRRRNTVVIGG